MDVACELLSLDYLNLGFPMFTSNLGAFPQVPTKHVIFVIFKRCVPSCTYVISVDLIPRVNQRPPICKLLVMVSCSWPLHYKPPRRIVPE